MGMNQKFGMETIELGNNRFINCWTKRTRSGTREFAELVSNGNIQAQGSYFWSNRPWQSFTYESAINDLVKNAGLNDDETKRIKDIASGKSKAELDSKLGMLKGLMKMGEVLHDDKKDQNDFKLRMMKASMGPGLIVPDDWDSLSEEEKTNRLNKASEVM